ncbi:hypothetical protein SLEP1_g29964 [Rubroshorea leprosula]|uniref:Uncharacterized protein n=1 Tax=Rubroshorea leprosula TaxID=152421 RepID=A0AAV5K8X8_9ROSI|nr:hypothetical protein SLEP1_g29964 [Rubroshorea leprosula]
MDEANLMISIEPQGEAFNVGETRKFYYFHIPFDCAGIPWMSSGIVGNVGNVGLGSSGNSGLRIDENSGNGGNSTSVSGGSSGNSGLGSSSNSGTRCLGISGKVMSK